MAYKKVSLYRQVPGRFANWFAQGNSLAMPPGKYYATVARQNYPDATFINGGASHVSVKTGTNIPDYIRRFGTDVKNLSIFRENPWWIVNFDKTKYLPEWSDQQCRDLVNMEMLLLGGQFPNMWVGAIEAYDEAWQWRMDMSYATRQVKIINEEFGRRFDAFGGWYYADYGGNLDLQVLLNTNSSEQLVQPISSFDAAHAWMTGNEAGTSQYFRQQTWQHGDYLQSGYILNNWSDYDFFFKAIMQLMLGRMAMSANAVTRKRRMISYYMPEGRQLLGYSEQYPKQPVTAGTIAGGSHPLQSYTSHVALGCAEYFFVEMRSQWSDSHRLGVDYGVLNTDTYGENLIPNGQPIVRKPVLVEYAPDGAGISAEPYGMHNGDNDGARWYCLIYQWTGTQNWTFCRYRTTASNATYCSLGTDYPVRRFQEKNPIAWLFSGVNGRKALFVVTPEGPWKTWQFDVGSSSPFEVTLAPNEPHLFLID